MIEQIIYLVITIVGVVIALATKDDTLSLVVTLVGMIVIGLLLSFSLGFFGFGIGVIGAGVLVSFIARDELKDGRVWFVVLIGVGIMLLLYGYLSGISEVMYFGAALIAFSLISFVLSYTRLARKRSSKI